MKLIVALGNPGTKYLKTRHNVGWLALDYLFPDAIFKEDTKLKGAVAKTADTILLKPLTFMNLSGQSVQQTLHYYKIPLENLTVIYDDIDLPFGDIRIREKGSAGTHNGMKSVINTLGMQEIRRIRLGIESRPEELKAKIPLDTFVLANFTASEQKALPKIFEQLIDEI